MPNTIKYSTSTQSLALKSGNYWLGVGDVAKGPTSSTDYWNGYMTPTDGYVVYLNKASDGPSIRVFDGDSALLSFTNGLAGTSFTSVTQCFNWYLTQSDKMVVNKNYAPIITDGLILNLDPSFRPSYSTSGATIYDLSFSSNTASIMNSQTYNSNGSITYDGVDEYLKVEPASNFVWTPSGTGGLNTFTLEILIKTSDTSGYVVSKPWNGGGVYNYLITPYCIDLRTTGSTSSQCFPTHFATGEWVFLDFVVTPTQFGSYKNGQTYSSFSNHNVVGNTGSGGDDNVALTFMCIYPYNNPFDQPSLCIAGDLSYVRMYNRQLTQAEVLNNYYQGNIITNNLILYLDAGNLVSYGGSGSNWYDLSTNVKNAILYNSPVFNSNGTLSFNGTDQYADGGDLGGTVTNFTVEVLLKFNLIDAKQGIFSSFNGGTSYGFEIQINDPADKIEFYVQSTAGADTVLTSSTFSTGDLVHITCVFQASGNTTIYIDGVSDNSVASTNTTGVELAPTYLVGKNNNGFFFEGDIFFVRVYDTAFNAAQVLQNYSAQQYKYQ